MTKQPDLRAAAATLGKVGGSKSSAAKRAAAKRNIEKRWARRITQAQIREAWDKYRGIAPGWNVPSGHASRESICVGQSIIAVTMLIAATDGDIPLDCALPRDLLRAWAEMANKWQREQS